MGGRKRGEPCMRSQARKGGAPVPFSFLKFEFCMSVATWRDFLNSRLIPLHQRKAFVNSTASMYKWDHKVLG